jgi:hypothetical protein
MKTPIRAFMTSLLLFATVTPMWSQESGRDHFMLRIGAAYDEGDFGASEKSRVLFVPITMRYLGNRFDASVTPSFARVNTTGGIQLIEGAPTRIGQPDRVRDSRSGVGDTVLRGRFNLLEDRSSSPAPALTPFIKMKLPTAQDDLSLGTGSTDYGFGIEWDKQFSPMFLFGDLSYTVIGKVDGLNLRNRPGASAGVGTRLSDLVSVSGLVDWRRSVIEGNPDWTELTGLLGLRITPSLSVNPYAFVGLTRGTSDFGLGTELSLRFGRY